MTLAVNSGDIKQLAKIIDRIAKNLPYGISKLLGERGSLTQEERGFILWQLRDGDGVHVAHDVDVSKLANEAITNVMELSILDSVGWDKVTQATRLYSQEFPQAWKTYTEYITFRGLPRFQGQRGVVEKISDDLHISRTTVYENIKHVPRNIAILALRI